jgi:phage protein D
MPTETTNQELTFGTTVKLDGRDLQPELAADLLGVEVEQHANGADAFELSVNIWDVERQDFKWLDDGTFVEGGAVNISMGYGEGKLPLFEGEIVALEVAYHADESPVLLVQGYDKLHRFRRGRNSRSWTDRKDSDIAREIAGQLNLRAEVTDTTLVHKHLMQYNQSDLDFLLERARRIHYELDIEQGALVFRPSAHADGKTETLEYRRDLQTLDLRLSTIDQVSKVAVRGWNPVTKEAIVGLAALGQERSMGGTSTGAASADTAFGDHQLSVVEPIMFDQGEADQVAKALFDAVSLKFIEAEGQTIGRPSLRAGEVVEIKKLGRRFSGRYYVTRVLHVSDADGYRTQFTCRRNAQS